MFVHQIALERDVVGIVQINSIVSISNGRAGDGSSHRGSIEFYSNFVGHVGSQIGKFS
ncbi:MAG: hypothetical protein KCHDKBKB_02007 [Elusimicrobia bacterium]|nr:hypothetical protein [Elusimicrobiota bacterium]